MDNMKHSFERIAKRYAEIKVKVLLMEREDAEILLKWAEAERDCAATPGPCKKMLAKKYGVLSTDEILLHRPGPWLDDNRGYLHGIEVTAGLLPEELSAALYHMMNEAADKEVYYRLGSDVRDFERETNRLSDMVNDVLCEAHALKEKRA